MPSTSETGNAKNVDNFVLLRSFCYGYGPKYNPAKPALTITSLDAIHTAAEKSLARIKTTLVTFNDQTNIRKETYQDLKPFCTRVLNALIASEASDLLIADAKTINRKIQGSKAIGNTEPTTTPTDAPAPPPKTISTSRQSFDSLKDNFKFFVELVSQEPSYIPNETELQVASLRAKAEGLAAANAAVDTAYTDLSNAMIERNDILYTPKKGLVPIALEVKKYIISLFGASSPQYKQVSGIEFRNPIKKK